MLEREELLAGLLQSQAEYRRHARGVLNWAKENSVNNAFEYCLRIGEYNRLNPDKPISPIPET